MHSVYVTNFLIFDHSRTDPEIAEKGKKKNI